MPRGDTSMKTWLMLTAASLFSVTGTLQAQSAADPLSSGAKATYTSVKSNVMKSADLMPESGYEFKPVASVRTFGQLLGQIADGEYELCAAVVNDGTQPQEVEKTPSSKTALIEGLKTA